MNLDVPYGMTRRLSGVDMTQARSRITEALKAEGFGVLTEIDVQATLKKKLDIGRSPYLILGACNPQLAHQALEHNPGVGLLLPCNVVVAQDGQDVLISAASPRALFAVVEGDETLGAIAEDAEARLQRAIERA